MQTLIERVGGVLRAPKPSSAKIKELIDECENTLPKLAAHADEVHKRALSAINDEQKARSLQAQAAQVAFERDRHVSALEELKSKFAAVHNAEADEADKLKALYPKVEKERNAIASLLMQYPERAQWLADLMKRLQENNRVIAELSTKPLPKGRTEYIQTAEKVRDNFDITAANERSIDSLCKHVFLPNFAFRKEPLFKRK